MIRLGIVGCGSVVQQYHAPAAESVVALKITAVADTNKDILAHINGAWNLEQTTTDYRELRDIDAILVAGPHAMHFSMCRHFLEKGIHVLVEKPMVLRSREAEELATLARDRAVVFAVGVFRRYYPVSKVIHAMIEHDWLGGVVEIDAEEGAPYDWELQSRFLLDREQAGGGVLIDTGSHLLDRLIWWFGGCEVKLVEYRDDSQYGVEADCEIRFDLLWGQRKIPCRVELSRTRTLRNTVIFRMREGIVELGANSPNEFSWGTNFLAGTTKSDSLLNTLVCERTTPREYFRAQLADFCQAIETKTNPVNSAHENLSAIRLIEECYKQRLPMKMPWIAPNTKRGQES